MIKTKQRTIAKPVEFSGIGIHTGGAVMLRFCPAPVDNGIVFKRIDLPGEPIIPATIDYVLDTQRCTIIGKNDAKIYTVEHVLAAVYANEIHNLIIEVSNIEPPVGDGSSSVFVDLLQQAGVVEQESETVVYTLTHPVTYSDGDIHLVALPSDHYRISYTLSYPNGPSILSSQYHSTVINSEKFNKDIAPCRTFCRFEEINLLMEHGLIKGGSLDNAVVIEGEIVHSKGGLFFDNEMVRHKILDIVGDLALMRVRFNAHVIAIRSGHASNFSFAKKLYQALILNQAQGCSKDFKMETCMSKNDEAQLTAMSVKDIVRILPHRYPFLLVDKILEINLNEGYIVGQKNLTINESFFQGHFPDAPIMPGVLILEALAQTGGVLVHLKLQTKKIAVLLNINEVKFRNPVRPGDVLILRCEGIHFSSKGGRIKATALVNGKVAVEGEMGFALVDKNQI